MAVHNGGPELAGTMEGILSQEGVRFEFLVVDDGSTDITASLLDRSAQTDPRIRVLHQSNSGLTAALIRGCNAARGDLIARQDAGDLSSPGRLCRQMELLASDASLSLVSCWARAVGPGNELLYDIRRPADASEATDLLLNRWTGPPHHGSVMFRRAAYERVEGYRKEFYFSQDSDLWLRLGEVGRLAYVPDILYTFRVTEDSISSRHRDAQGTLGNLSHDCQDARRAGRAETDLLVRASALRPGSAQLSRGDFTDGAYFIGRCLVRQRDPRARAYLLKVIKRRPLRLGAWLGLLRTYGLPQAPA